MDILSVFSYLQQSHPSEAWTLTSVVSGLLILYTLAGIAFLYLLLHRGRQAPLGLLWCARGLVTIAVFGILCGSYAYSIEPNWLEIKHVQLDSAKLPAGARPIRIVHISDLHCEARPGLEETLPVRIAALKPDVIAFTGDAINEPAGLPTLKRCLKRLATIAPTFVVTGNHDVNRLASLDLFGQTGVRELRAEALPLFLNGGKIWISGVPADRQNYTRALHTIPFDEYSVFLDHYSDGIIEVARQDVDLYLCGHTHGGQIALPFYGAIITFSQFGKKYESGLYRVDQTWLYVNRGIGMDGWPYPRMRFCARPEVTAFEIRPAVD